LETKVAEGLKSLPHWGKNQGRIARHAQYSRKMPGDCSRAYFVFDCVPLKK
jgi:hypothetical protein